MHREIVDPFAAACFPPASEEQRGIVYNLDQVDAKQDGSTVLVNGWAADIHGGEQVDISLAESPVASLRSLSRYGRPDVNAITTVPQILFLASVQKYRCRVDASNWRTTSCVCV